MQSTSMDRETPASRNEIADFYDGFNERLVRDYVHGNPRFDAAVDRVLSVVDQNTHSVLDIGCGVGLSSMLVKQQHPEVAVTGADISPENIRLATTLFGDTGVDFKVSNLEDDVIESSFDLIAMIDVHEHIPRDAWPKFHATLSKLLSEDGTVVITYPSELHQAYLRDSNPDGLQVVDETIRLDDIQALAERIGGTIVLFEYLSVWNSNDYVHAVITRSPKYESLPRPKQKSLAQAFGGIWLQARHKIRVWQRKRNLSERLKRTKDAD